MPVPKTVSWEDSWLCSAPTQEWSNRSKLCRDDTAADTLPATTKKLSTHLLTSIPPPPPTLPSFSPTSIEVAIHSTNNQDSIQSPADDGSDSVFAGLESDDSLVSKDSLGNNMALKRWRDLERKRLAFKLEASNDNHPLLFESIDRRSKKSATTSTSRSTVTPQKPSGPQQVLVLGEPVLWSGSVDPLQSLPIGFGEMLFRDGQRYTGQCQSGLRHGRNGRNVWSNNQAYVGEWRDGKRSGKGSHVWHDGRRVSGSWQRGHLHGTVHFSWPDGSSYVGGTVNGRKEGKGRQIWSDGRVYEGDYVDGYEHGVGTLTEADRVIEYCGQFQRGTRHGEGSQVWSDKVYTGQWKHNQVTGRGELRWKRSGDTYNGEFKNGQFHGHGSFRAKNSGYIGEWKQGVKEGVGSQFWEDGRAYEGSFVQGRFHGFGCLVQLDGSLYTGTWSNGKRNGSGISLKADGSVEFCGYWKDDLPIAQVQSFDETEFSNPFDEVDIDNRQKLLSKGSLLDGSTTTASEEKSLFWD